MSRKITVDGPTGFTFIVSDAEYASIDWGSSGDDVVAINLEDGGAAILNWGYTAAVFIGGASPSPGSYPGWLVEASGPYGGISGLLVDDATKDVLVTAMAVADVILEFTTLQGTEVKLPSKNVTAIAFHPGDYVVPS